jgi:WD40 repeat protein
MASLQSSDPRQVGAYRLIERLAVGGMGIVYLGESQSGRKVAVKLIRLEQAGEPEFRARFRSEVAACRLVSGFHTAAFIDADADADRPWMVTQYVPGPSLEARVTRDGALAPAAVHQLAAALAEGLDAIHSAGLVHRDLKPGNVIMADDGPRIIDFGIAKRTGDSGDLRLTATGIVVGTPAFLSPEQLGHDSPVGPASDIFSLGSVLAFAATGRAPFDVGDLSATMYAIVNRPPNLRLAAGPLLGILTACLAKDPADRPTAAALLTYLYRTRSSRLTDLGPDGDDGAGRAAVPVLAATPDPSGPLPRNPALASPAAVAPAVVAPGVMTPGPAKPAPVRAFVRRGALARRPPVTRVLAPPVSVRPTEGAEAGLPQVLPSPVQVRPARHGWRLVASGATSRWLASANGDGVITSWLAASGQPVRSWPAEAGVLVVATDDGRVRAWDVATGIGRRYLPDSVASLTGPGVRVRGLGLDPSGSWLAASVDGRLLLWDVTDPGEPLLAAKLPTRAEVTALAFDDTGWRLATGDADGKIHVWDLAELAEAAPVPATPGASAFDAVPLETTWIDPPGTLPDASRPQSGRVLALAWDDARDRWLSVGAHGRPDGAAARGTATDGIGIAGVPLRAAALSPGGGFAAMIDDVRGRVYVADLDRPADGGAADPRVLDGTDVSVTGVAFADSGMLAIGGSDGSLRVWDPARRAARLVRAAGRPATAVAAVAASPRGDRLVISDRRARLHSFTAVNGSFAPGWAVDSPSAGEHLAFRADGTRLATAGEMARIWEAADGSPAGILPGRTGRARAVAADHDGSLIAVAWAESVVTVWQGRKLLWELTGHYGAVVTVAFAPRPGLLLSAGDDHTIRTWDLATGKEVACHAPLGYRVTVLAASRPGGAIAGGCADGTIRLCAGGQPGTPPDWTDAPVLAGHVHGITAMSFDLSGRFLATASRDGTARVWDLASRSATTVLLPRAAAVVCADGTWRGLGQTDGLLWQAVGLTRVPLPTLEADT